jgi:hypothetical protein
MAEPTDDAIVTIQLGSIRRIAADRDAAEKKLADLVREVRELNRQECELPSFERLADKYDPKPEGGG